jgi:hypothetical protein
MRGFGDRIETQPVRQADIGQRFLEAARNILAFFSLSAYDQTELKGRRHDRPPVNDHL